MARFRKRARRAASRAFYFARGGRGKRGQKARTGRFMGAGKLALGAAIWGAARNTVAQTLSPVTNMIPLGAYSDNAVLGGAALLADRFFPGLEMVWRPAIAVEAAIAGGKLAQGFMGAPTAPATSTVVFL